MKPLLPLLTAMISVPLAAGCQPDVERGATAKPAEAAQEAPRSETVVQGGGSALGQAKGAAERTVDRSDAYQRNLERQIEDINKP